MITLTTEPMFKLKYIKTHYEQIYENIIRTFKIAFVAKKYTKMWHAIHQCISVEIT